MKERSQTPIIKKPERPFTQTPTKPVIADKKPECQKKHITQNGKK